VAHFYLFFKTMSTYPLLVKGFSSNQNGSNSSRLIAPGTSVTWSNVIVENRGDIVAVDVLTTMPLFFQSPNLENTPLGNYNLYIGGMNVVNNASLNETIPVAFPRSYEFLRLRQKGGQTIQLEANNATNANTFGTYLHVYHVNKFATPEIIAARNTSSLKQRTFTTSSTFAGGQRLQRGNPITVPTASGNIVAIEIICTQSNDTDTIADDSTLSIYVDGNSIFEDVNTSLFTAKCARPGLIFPILIRPGSTIQIEADTMTATPAETLEVNLKLYFDDDITGRQSYATNG
jgi:hypothetical protein